MISFIQKNEIIIETGNNGYIVKSIDAIIKFPNIYKICQMEILNFIKNTIEMNILSCENVSNIY